MIKVTQKVGLKRLNKLADYLQNEVKPKKFNLGSWASMDNDEYSRYYDEKFLNDSLLNPSCGTTACAFGHAGTMKSFKRAGLKLSIEGFSEIVKYKGYEGFNAASLFFGVDYDTATYMFDPCEYDKGRQSKSYVVKRIRNVVKQLEKELSVK